MRPREHTTRQYTFYFNLAMLTYHIFLPHMKPLAAISSYELWLHIPLNEAWMPQCSTESVVIAVIGIRQDNSQKKIPRGNTNMKKRSQDLRDF